MPWLTQESEPWGALHLCRRYTLQERCFLTCFEKLTNTTSDRRSSCRRTRYLVLCNGIHSVISAHQYMRLSERVEREQGSHSRGWHSGEGIAGSREPPPGASLLRLIAWAGWGRKFGRSMDTPSPGNNRSCACLESTGHYVTTSAYGWLFIGADISSAWLCGRVG